MNNTITFGGGEGVSSCSTSGWDPWQPPVLVETRVFQDRIELIYRQDPSFTYTSTGHFSQPSPRITKKVYKAELINEVEGRWIEPSQGYFDFNDDIHND